MISNVLSSDIGFLVVLVLPVDDVKCLLSSDNGFIVVSSISG